jgi:DNA-binding MarR family transcriptional regulator
MDYIRHLGKPVLDHRLRRIVDTLLRSAEQVYQARGPPFKGKWASTYTLLHENGRLAVGQIAERLRLTHPAVIAITNEMVAADIVTAQSDPADARRRLLELTPRGRAMGPELFTLWKHIGDAQTKRFEAAGCDIMRVLEHVEDGLAERPLADEVLAKLNAKGQMRRASRVTAAILFAVAIASAFAGRPAYAQQTIDATRRAELVNALADTLVNGYVYEAVGRRAADTLRWELKSGAYDALNGGDDFARRINETLRRVVNDGHLGVTYKNAGQRMRTVQPLPAASATVERPKGISRVIAEPDLGIPFAQVLDGKIGYVEIEGFSGDTDALATVDSIMAMFADAKAIIIDVGRNRGGGPLVIQHLSGYLFDKPVHLVSSIMRGMDKPRDRWSSEKIPGKKLPTIPVYVLTSRRTISAAESFAFGLRNHKRITIVGERTAGGGHFGGFVEVAPELTVFLPRGRTYNPATNEGWEAEGLKPDVEVPYSKALETAIGLAKAR